MRFARQSSTCRFFMRLMDIAAEEARGGEKCTALVFPELLEKPAHSARILPLKRYSIRKLYKHQQSTSKTSAKNLQTSTARTAKSKKIVPTMEEEEDETTSRTASTITLTQNSISRTSTSTFVSEGQPQCQIVTQQASGDSLESEESSLSQKISPRYSLLSKSPHSSSSQEDYEPDPKRGQFLSAGVRTETAKSMESLRTSSRCFLSTSERDMRRVFSESVETKSLDNLEREMRLKRHAISGEGSALTSSGSMLSSDETINAEKRRGLWSGKVRVPSHLSLPPPAGYLNLSPGDRKLTILSPHSPHRMPDLMHLAQTTLKTRRKKAMVLPRLVLPRSDSDISEVFSEHSLDRNVPIGARPMTASRLEPALGATNGREISWSRPDPPTDCANYKCMTNRNMAISTCDARYYRRFLSFVTCGIPVRQPEILSFHKQSRPPRRHYVSPRRITPLERAIPRELPPKLAIKLYFGGAQTTRISSGRVCVLPRFS
ncbi:hypothetical protein GEV33_015052 [Tenebrio molitor]|uniref:Uncharacterized protein n=2 Tax=Tenebrio molitor TaxID=7067 RepID=A0A8J6H3Z6_TENMO|nr:hypothetical protein GEV33_015052 [Tenebrio molitor]